MTDKNGIPYGEKSLEELYTMLDAMLKRLERNNLTPAQKETIESKITAIYLLFDAAKKQGSY